MKYLVCAIHPSGEVISSGEVFENEQEAYDAACEYTEDLNDVLFGMGEEDSLLPIVEEVDAIQ